MQGDVSAIEGGGGLTGGLLFVVRRAAAGTEGAKWNERGQWTAGEEKREDTLCGLGCLNRVSKSVSKSKTTAGQRLSFGFPYMRVKAN